MSIGPPPLIHHAKEDRRSKVIVQNSTSTFQYYSTLGRETVVIRISACLVQTLLLAQLYNRERCVHLETVPYSLASSISPMLGIKFDEINDFIRPNANDI